MSEDSITPRSFWIQTEEMIVNERELAIYYIHYFLSCQAVDHQIWEGSSHRIDLAASLSSMLVSTCRDIQFSQSRAAQISPRWH